MLWIKNITKRFADGQRQLTVLDDLSLHVEEGEFMAIMGESGAGKTTLLNILGTLLPADEGSYMMRGEQIEVSGEQPSERLCHLRNKEIGFVYQDHRLLPQFTVWQNILLPTLATKKTSTEGEQLHALALLEFMGILPLKDCPVTQLSGGEKTRVAICRALINQPAILLADEPTGALDQKTGAQIMQLFRELNEEKRTVIMITHDLKIASNARRIVHIIDGEISEGGLQDA